jgi:hypothetical protein
MIFLYIMQEKKTFQRDLTLAALPTQMRPNLSDADISSSSPIARRAAHAPLA